MECIHNYEKTHLRLEEKGHVQGKPGVNCRGELLINQIPEKVYRWEGELTPKVLRLLSLLLPPCDDVEHVSALT